MSRRQPVHSGEFRYTGILPYPLLQQRLRTGQTPPPALPPRSPLGSPPEHTPRTPPPVKPEEYSPQKYPVDIPPYNVREVETPPKVIGSPFWYHSTPKSPVRYPVPPEEAGRVQRKKERQKALDEMRWTNSNRWLIFSSPVTCRQDIDSFFEEEFIGGVTPPPKPSPKYTSQKTPPRSPALELMRQEIKRDAESSKYRLWVAEHEVKAASRDSLMEKIISLLRSRIPVHDISRISVHEAVGMLSEYLKEITEKLITQNLELPPLDEHNPALNLIIQKKISIRRIIEEFSDANRKLEGRLSHIKWLIQLIHKHRIDPAICENRAKYRKELKELQDMRKRVQRIKESEGFCIRGCQNRQDAHFYKQLSVDMEKQWQELRRQSIINRTAVMEAAANTTVFHEYVTPSFLQHFAIFIRNMFPKNIPDEVFDAAAKDVSAFLRRIWNKMRHDWLVVNREINELYSKIDKEMAEADRMQEEIDKCQKETERLKLECRKKNILTHVLKWMVLEARNTLEYREQGLVSTRQLLIEELKMTEWLETKLGMAPTGPPELGPWSTPSPIITSPPSPFKEAMGPPIYVSSPTNQSQPETCISPEGLSEPDIIDGLQVPPEMFYISGQQGSGFSSSPYDSLEGSKSPIDSLAGSKSPIDSLEGSKSPIDSLERSKSPIDSLERSKSPIDSLEGSATSIKKSFVIPSPGRREKLQMDVEIIPQDIRRSPSGQRVVCDLAVEMHETPSRHRPTGRTRFDRKHGLFTPRSSFLREHVVARGPLFEGDFESTESQSP